MNWLNIISPSNVPLDGEALLQFEQELGGRLPSDYREFLFSCNGGKITAKHTFETKICDYAEDDISLSYLLPLSKKNPLSGGVIECRTGRYKDKVGIERAIEIGDDGGTGFFFLMLSQRFFGQVYFTWKDVIQSNSPDWRAGVEMMPDYMGLVGTSFTDFGERIQK